jgi:hypothetical protein
VFVSAARGGHEHPVSIDRAVRPRRLIDRAA